MLFPRSCLVGTMVLLVLSSCTRSPAYRKEAGQGGHIQGEKEREKTIEAVQKFAPLRKRAVLLPFWNDTPIKGKFEVQARNALRDMLLEQNRLNIVDDRDVSLRSQDFYLDADKINVAHVADNGKKWGVSLVIIGRISKIAFRRKDDDVGLLRPSAAKAAASIELRLVDVAQAKEIALGQGAGMSESSSLNLFGESNDDTEAYRNEIVAEAIGDAVRKAMPALNKEIDRIQWRGKIAKISGAKLYINAGRATGVQVGDILKVSSSGQDIFDPDSGLFLGRTGGDLKGTLEVTEFFGEDGAISRVHSGGNFIEGDMIQLY
ncbi:MAG: CsgG/HfaB family protein [Bdellovibrionota bacterium]